MSVIRWPDPINLQRRLAEGINARAFGASTLADTTQGCPQTLHVNLFFDGTNNNMYWDTKNAAAPTHTNVARLFGACPLKTADGIYPYYIPGVGTPFPEIGETEFSSMGKAMACGFGMRVVWGYTRLLNALHQAMTGNILLGNPAAHALCSLIDDEVIISNGTLPQVLDVASGIAPEVGSEVKVGVSAARLYYGYKSQAMLRRLHGELSALQKKHSSPGGQLDRSIKKVWVNVFGFSRGAASARVFVNQLVNTWAKDNKIAGVIPYELNFLGLFDTVASVGIPDSATAAVNLSELDGHWAWTAHGALNVPAAVRKCVHFFSIHEQRMSFPLDSIREMQAYPVGEPRRIEIAYPGVHSDVGGGYAVGEQGKAREGNDAPQHEGSKLSQIALHNMYIEALKAGVPLMIQGDILKRDDLVRDFSLSSVVAQAFNDWLSTVNQTPLDSVETALRVGMGQSLTWRTLRADIGNPQSYVTSQEFYKRAPEDPVTPYGLETRIASKAVSSDQLDKLKREKSALEEQKSTFEAAALSVAATPALADPFKKKANELDQQIKQKDIEIEAATAGNGSPQRPGEEITDLTTNDKTDLLEAAEEFRLLLAYLRPDQRTRWQVSWATAPAGSVKLTSLSYDKGLAIEQNPNAYYLTVDRADTSSHRRQGSKVVWMGERDRVLQLLGTVAGYRPVLDFVLVPRPEMFSFLLEHTSDDAVRTLSPAVIRLMDDHVHDSRAWFRVPYFHEYAPGGFGWARTFFVGNDYRVRYLGLPTGSASAQRDAQATADLGDFIAARSATLPPLVNADFFSNAPR